MHPPTRRVGHQLIWAVVIYGVAMLAFALVAGLKPTSLALVLALSWGFLL